MANLISSADKQTMVSSFLEVVVGQSSDTAHVFLQAAKWTTMLEVVTLTARRGMPKAGKVLKFLIGSWHWWVSKAYNYIHKNGYKSKLMAAIDRNKQDLFSLLRVYYIIAPFKVLHSLKDSVTTDVEKYAYIRRLSPQSTAAYEFTENELVKWDQKTFASAMGPAAMEFLRAGLHGYVNQAKQVEELFSAITSSATEKGELLFGDVSTR